MMWDGYYTKDTVKEEYDLLENPKVSLEFYRAQKDAEDTLLLMQERDKVTAEVLTYLTNYKHVILQRLIPSSSRYELYSNAVTLIDEFFTGYDQTVVDMKLKDMGIINYDDMNNICYIITAVYVAILLISGYFVFTNTHNVWHLLILSLINAILCYFSMLYAESTKRVYK